MRAYFFGNMYLSSIQQGIQAAHVTAELFIEPQTDKAKEWLNEWAINHKTMILLNAGYASEIQSLIQFFDTEENDFPWAYFNEEEAALNGAFTSVGIVLPKYIYDRNNHFVEEAATGKIVDGVTVSHVVQHSDLYRLVHIDSVSGEETLLSKWETALVDRIGRYGLAR